MKPRITSMAMFSGRNFLTIASLVISALALWVAWVQLREANGSLRAANTIALAREERDTADRIVAAGGDETKLNDAFDRFGDHMAYAAYLYGMGQIDDRVWLDIRSGFCDLMTKNEKFDNWYSRNVATKHLISFYPQFGELRSQCIDAQPKS